MRLKFGLLEVPSELLLYTFLIFYSRDGSDEEEFVVSKQLSAQQRTYNSNLYTFMSFPAPSYIEHKMRSTNVLSTLESRNCHTQAMLSVACFI